MTTTNTCPRYSFCRFDHTDPREVDDYHGASVGYGIEADVDNSNNDQVTVNWQPDFLEWVITPGEIAREVAELRELLAKLPEIVAAVVREVHTPLIRRTEPGEPEFAGIGGGL